MFPRKAQKAYPVPHPPPKLDVVFGPISKRVQDEELKNNNSKTYAYTQNLKEPSGVKVLNS